MLGTTLALGSGCGLILGLDQYEIDDSLGGEGDGDGDGTGGTEGTGGRGAGGMPITCGGVECDDENDCTRDSCIDDECIHTTLEAGEACDGGVCNGRSGNSSCVRCIDDESGVETDAGCDDSRPVCDQSGPAVCVECVDHASCDDDNDCTTDRCSSGTCEYEEATVGSACSGGVCAGESGRVSCVPCIDDASGDAQDTGCPAGSPRCEDDGGLVCVGCETDDDCDVSNECRPQTCNDSSQCVPATVSAGSSCADGVCNGVPGSEECVACVNDATGGNQDAGCSLTQPVCDPSGGGECRICVDDANVSSVDTGCNSSMPVCDPDSGYSCVVCADDRGPGNQDSGCTVTDPFCVSGSCVECEGPDDCGGATPICSDGGTCVECGSNTDCGGNTPYCDLAGSCVECLNVGHCGDGVGCTDDACNGGVCSNTPDDDNCADSGDACNPNVCHPTNGCQQMAVAPSEVELISNGNFENGDANWTEVTNSGFELIGAPVSDVGAYSGSQVAWLCGDNLEQSELYQQVTIPTGATEFTVRGYYRVDFQNGYNSGTQNDPSDNFVGGFQSQAGAPLGDASDLFLSLDGTTQSTMWTAFQKTYTNVSDFTPGTPVRFDFWCENDNQPGDVAFLFDDVSILAKICQ